MRTTSKIRTAAFYSDLPKSAKENPLFLGCSAGNGHNTANEGLKDSLIEENILGEINTYLPQLPEDKLAKTSAKSQLEFGLKLTHEIPVLSSFVRFVLKHSPYPVLPLPTQIENEVEKLKKGQLTSTGEKKPRHYVDMLLDIYSTGYEYAAIWNVLQRNDLTEELKKLVRLQKDSDKKNHELVRQYFIEKLEEAAKAGNPHTSIISTQAMALPAICEAVEFYNQNIAQKYKANPIKIHQYITDLAPGSIHFFDSLARLTNHQCQQMYLYGVGMTDSVLKKYQLTDKEFAGIFDINPKKNPMVRAGFRHQKPIQPDQQIVLSTQVDQASDQLYSISADEKIASIMLGSQASLDTIEYVKVLSNNELYSRIFVFGGKTPHIKKELDKLLSNDTNAPQIILLDSQNDWHIAPLLMRSNLIIKRGGGLSIMEEMAIPHLAKQIILIHCKAEHGQLNSGIIWEDENVNYFITFSKEAGFIAQRTATNIFAKQLSKISVYYSNSSVPFIFNNEEFILPENNKPIWHQHLSGNSLKDNHALAQKNGLFFAIDQDEPFVFKDVKRANLIIEHISISCAMADNEVEKYLNSLSTDEGVRYFLTHKFTQDTLLFAGHDSLQDEILLPNKKLYRLSNKATFLYPDKDGKVLCRVITYGFELNDHSASLEIEEVIPSNSIHPSMIIDTAYLIVPATEENKQGAKLEVVYNTKLIYHPNLDFYLPNLKPASWVNFYNFLRNNPFKALLTSVSGSGLVLGSLFLTSTLMPENMIGETAASFINFDTIGSVLGMLGSLTTGAFTTAFSYVSLGTVITQIKSRKTVTDYQKLIEDEKNPKEKPSCSSQVIIQVLKNQKEEESDSEKGIELKVVGKEENLLDVEKSTLVKIEDASMDKEKNTEKQTAKDSDFFGSENNSVALTMSP